MAIDTAGKRMSCIGLGGVPWRLRPIPDGSLAAAADRAHLAFLYAGIALAVPIVGDPVVIRLSGRHDAPTLRGRADTAISLKGRI